MSLLKYIFLFYIVYFISNTGKPTNKQRTTYNNIYIISIGIDKYRRNTLINCESDAQAIVQKIKSDDESYIKEGLKLSKTDTTRINGIKADERVHYYTLLGKEATKKNIINSFKKVINASKTDDIFIFYFAGMSEKLRKLQTTLLITHQTNGFFYRKSDINKHIKISELASLMDQIPCDRQLVVSEASDDGESFAKNLIASLFESNPILAANTNRNRIIITTKNYGAGNSRCDRDHGPLTGYILRGERIPSIFTDFNKYEFELNRQEIACPFKDDTKYFAIYQENDYRDILTKQYRKTKSRGAIVVNTGKEKDTCLGDSKTYAILLATNTYNPNQHNWRNLENPINDAKAIAKLLSIKYGVHVKTSINTTKREAMEAITSIKDSIDANDRFLFFVAGHGYYSKENHDGYLVFKDAISLDDEYEATESYLSMGSLNRLLDGVDCKQVFAIFDVCFGGSFDSANGDLALSNYKILKDIPLDSLVKRKSKYNTRIFLASGKGEVPDYWDNSLDHSPFANKLIETLKKEKEFISPGKLYSAIEANATEPVLKRFGKHEERGDFLLKVVN